MLVDLCASHEFGREPRKGDTEDGLIVLVDVLRATTFIPTALYAGASEVVLIKDAQQALAYKTEHPEVLLAGERSGFRLDGFDLGNNPSLLEKLLGSAGHGSRIVLSSGNFCRVIGRFKNPLVAGSLVNADAVVDYVIHQNPDTVYFVSTGTYHFRGREYEKPLLTIDDDLVALALVHSLFEKKMGLGFTSGVYEHHRQYRDILRNSDALHAALWRTPYAQELLDHRDQTTTGDVRFCLRPNVAAVVPVLDRCSGYLTMRSAHESSCLMIA